MKPRGVLGDRAAGAGPQGVHSRVLEYVRVAVGGGDLVPEHQRVGAAAVVVAGRAARVEQQLERPIRQDGGVERDPDVDCRARPVRAAGSRLGGDVCDGRCRRPDQLDAVVVDRGDKDVGASALAERGDAVRAGELGKAACVVGNRSGGEQGAVAAAHVDKLDAAGIHARGHRRVHAAVTAAAEQGDAEGALQPVKARVAVRG